MSTLRILAVDDEPLALSRIAQVLTRIPGVLLVGAAGGCAEAIALTAQHRPDVLLLDISMRDGTGFDLLEKLPERDLAVIFTTAYDHFAVRAFDVCAVDYVLKPISVARLRDALERARRRLETRDAGEQLAELQLVLGDLRRQVKAQTEKDAEFWVRGASGSLVRVLARDVEWIKSEDDYVRLHTRASSHLLRGSIRGILAELGATDFIRVHRNAVVRLASIRALHRRSLGTLEVELHSGVRVPTGRVYAKQLRSTLGDRPSAQGTERAGSTRSP